MLCHAGQIGRDASRIAGRDIRRLRDAGLSIALAAALRNILSRYFDAVGAPVGADFLDPDPDPRRKMPVGGQQSRSGRGGHSRSGAPPDPAETGPAGASLRKNPRIIVMS
ncbi:alkylhydroperoxidase AhpD family core domain protein [Oceaniovalibus guishaninsula JLT2003]|uniref:Alkylhydroperoxidase AhpD family core domain protein n=1 Tax=Oceaniovalibus guishaninsula JLT2003 TaxID=1231392 RepID=K2H9H7_9RHOB|nr:alkylhydroperoxidase AhpD family core domain protein [Oceaniovalibus guishaninsula JLT2003]